MKWSKSRAVMVVVVGAGLSNVWSLWCGSPGMLRPARGSPTPTDRMFAPFRRLPPSLSRCHKRPKRSSMVAR